MPSRRLLRVIKVVISVHFSSRIVFKWTLVCAHCYIVQSKFENNRKDVQHLHFAINIDAQNANIKRIDTFHSMSKYFQCCIHNNK